MTAKTCLFVFQEKAEIKKFCAVFHRLDHLCYQAESACCLLLLFIVKDDDTTFPPVTSGLNVIDALRRWLAAGCVKIKAMKVKTATYSKSLKVKMGEVFRDNRMWEQHHQLLCCL